MLVFWQCGSFHSFAVEQLLLLHFSKVLLSLLFIISIPREEEEEEEEEGSSRLCASF